MDDITQKLLVEYNLIKLQTELKNYFTYIKANQKAVQGKAYKGARKPLADLLINTIRKSIYSKDQK